MKKLIRLKAYLCCWALYSASVAIADDTDIYLNTGTGGGAPYLMFMLDYRQDLSGPYCKNTGSTAARCKNVLNTVDGFPLLQSLDVIVNGVPGDADGNGVGDSAAAAATAGDANFDGLRDSAAVMADFEASKIQALISVMRVVFEKFDGINVGMMVPNNNGGGTILRGYQLFVPNDTNGAKRGLVDILLRLPMPNTGGAYHESQPKEMHYEWYSYINGGRVYYGNNTAANFQGTNTPAPDTSVRSGVNYISPFASADPADYECANLYSVYITSGNESGQDSDLDTQIASSMNATADNSFEDMMYYMARNDLLTGVSGTQSLTSWFVRVGSSDAKADDWARAAGTDDQYMVVAGGAADLVNVAATLEAAFIEALSVSTTFVAASVPVNVFNRVQTMDNFFIALFEAKSDARWPGNLKKLKLADTDLVPDGVFDDIVDATGATAFSNDDGRIKYEALTFWTDQTTLPPANPDNNEVASRDGRAVERGGAGQQVPGFVGGTVGDTNSATTRRLYYEPTSAGALLDLNATTAIATSLQTSFAASSSTNALASLRWLRGIDVNDQDADGNITENRPWLLGDAIHSRPLAINYGATTGYSESNPNIRLFMGTNDGIFHIFENTTAAGAESGRELWGFAPRELMKNVPTLRANVSGTRVYGVDGEPVALVKDLNANGTIETGDSVLIYFGLRRGGKSYYMLDASDPSNPPRFGFKITKTSGGNFDELGMTFSKPAVTKVRYGGTTVDVLIFAGGYDTNKDRTGTDTDGNRTGDTEGNAIYIVNAQTGALIWKVAGGASTGAVSNTLYRHADMDFAIPSDVTVLDADRNGVADRLYVGDLGGQVWRVDLPEGNSSADTSHRQNRWSAMVFANVSSAAEADDRRFFHAPDLVQTRDSLGDYDAVVLASGDRANPLETSDANRLIVLKDRFTPSGNPPSTTLTLGDLANADTCIACTAADLRYGWYARMTDTGEKGLSSPLVINGKVFFTSYVPNNGISACAPAEGNGKLYVLDLTDGAESFSGSRGMDVGPGIPASPIALSGDMLLLPGTGIGSAHQAAAAAAGLECDNRLCRDSGKSVWQLYWRSSKDKR